MENNTTGKDSKHYSKVSIDYDEFYQIIHKGIVNFIKHYIPLKKTDTIVDIGGGTGEVINLLKKEFAIECPGVCVEPNEEMIAIAAKKEGVIPIMSTAETFLAQQPSYPMNFVLLSGMNHYLTNFPDTVRKVASFIKAVRGTCLIATYPFPVDMWFKAALSMSPKIDGDDIPDICQQHGVEYLKVERVECFEVKKKFWYQCLRGRFASALNCFTDDEIEEGIAELEKKYFDVEVLNYNLVIDAWILKSI